MDRHELVVDNDDFSIQRLELGPYGTNAYIVVCKKTRECVLVDAPGEGDLIKASLRDLKPRCILLTHNHGDHTGALCELSSDGIPVAVHPGDSSLPCPAQMLLNDGDTVSIGSINIEVLHTPGHTPGSLCFRLGKYVLAGDTVFPGGPGRTPDPHAFQKILDSVKEKILRLPDDVLLFPGHGSPALVKQVRDEFSAFMARPRDPNLCGDVTWLKD